jgi:proteic killer suppression protein
VIKSFGNKLTAQLWRTGKAARFPANLCERALDKLQILNAAGRPEILRIPPGNRLEALRGDYRGFWSIRINDQWGIVFRFLGEDAYDVAIVDYH